MDSREQDSEEYVEIANKIRSGEYFRDARAMVDIDIHEPMSDRYWFLFITIMSFLTTGVAIIAWLGFYPLKPKVPFIFATNDVLEDYPRVTPLQSFRGEDPNAALQRHLVKHYTKLREEYNADYFDRNHNAVGQISSPDVLDEYERFVSPLNHKSPVSLYQRHTQRKINIISMENIENNYKKEDGVKEYYAIIVYEEILKIGETENRRGQYQVDIAFLYKDIKLDKTTGKIEPYRFYVTSYKVKNL
jgi:type IV secretory pathway component VirB8